MTVLRPRPSRLSQPPGLAGVDWGNPFERGLRSIIVGNQPKQGRSGVSQATRFGTYTLHPQGFVPNGSTGYLTYPSDSENYNETTILTIATPYAAPASGNAGIAFHGTDSNDPGRPCLRACITSTGTLVAVNQTGAGANTSSSSSTNYVGRRVVAVATRSYGASTIYADGVSIGTSSGGGATDDNGGVKVIMLGRNGQGFGYTYFNGLIELTLVWNRALSAGEVARISANPWQIFRPTNRDIYFDSAVGGGPVFKPFLARGSNQIIRALT